MKKTLISTSIALACCFSATATIAIENKNITELNKTAENKEKTNTTISPIIKNDGLDKTRKYTIDNRNKWFENINNNVISHYPEIKSKASELDKNISNEHRKKTGKRLELAKSDQSQEPNYMIKIFGDKILKTRPEIKYKDGKVKQAKQEPLAILNSSDLFNRLLGAYNNATKVGEGDSARSMDFVLKGKYLRGRPNQVIDEKGDYLPDYRQVKGSSFPSGHTWDAFKHAAVFSMLFPEKGAEIIARATEYGESRVILGMHFPTDTIASRAGNYYLLAQVLSDEETVKELIPFIKRARTQICPSGVNTHCLLPTESRVDDSTGHYKTAPTQSSTPLITPDLLPKEAANLLRLHFPYLAEKERLMIIAGTAYSPESLAGWNIQPDKPDSYWGAINLIKAYDGPAYLYDDFKANLKIDKSKYITTATNEWKNDISGPGKLILSDGTLTLTGNNTFGGLVLSGGSQLTLTGAHTHQQTSLVNGGKLIIKNAFNSPLDINKANLTLTSKGKINAPVRLNKGAKLEASGEIRDLTVNEGATALSSSDVSHLKITNSVTFEPGSHYRIDVNNKGESDRISSAGTATLNGGIVTVYLKPKTKPMIMDDMISVADTKYTILSADKGITGKFEQATPEFLFIGATLHYSPTEVTLHLNRNDLKFESLVETKNQKSFARVADQLSINNPLVKSIAVNNTIKHAQETIDSLTGQIHADVLSNQINQSRQLRNLLTEQIRFSEAINPHKNIHDSKVNVWTSLLHDWDSNKSDGNARDYHSYVNGVFLGIDKPIFNDRITLGVAGGFSQTHLSAIKNSVRTDEYHVAAYGGINLSPVFLRTGLQRSWHDITTSSTISYTELSDRKSSEYATNTNQAFIETAYAFNNKIVNLEPFAQLAYINTTNKKIKERGDAAALRADRQHINALLSTIGTRLEHQWKINETTSVSLKGELGWQRQYGNLERGIKFNIFDVKTPIETLSITAPRDSFAYKVGTNFDFDNNYRLSIDYSNLRSNNYNNNNVDAKLSVAF